MTEVPEPIDLKSTTDWAATVLEDYNTAKDSGDIVEAEWCAPLALALGHLIRDTLKVEAENSRLHTRLSDFTCAEHLEAPKYGECVDCDRSNTDESWRNTEI